jgi:hypothetical protein
LYFIDFKGVAPQDPVVHGYRAIRASSRPLTSPGFLLIVCTLAVYYPATNWRIADVDSAARIIAPEVSNQLGAMHATIVIFFAGVPLAVGAGTLLISS